MSSLVPTASSSEAQRAPDCDPLDEPLRVVMDSRKGDPAEQTVELENGTRMHLVDGVQSHKPGGAAAFIKKAAWHGGSVYDAWLNAVSAQVRTVRPLFQCKARLIHIAPVVTRTVSIAAGAKSCPTSFKQLRLPCRVAVWQVGQVILSMPTSYAQMGFKLGLFFHFLYVIIGLYTCYLLAGLYVEYRARKEKEGVDFRHHVIQYHELLGALVGKWAMIISIFFNIITVGAVAVIQIIACARSVALIYFFSRNFIHL